MEHHTPSRNITDFSTDGNRRKGHEEGIDYGEVMYITCFIITSILGIVGNGLVIWITGFKMQKTMTTTWVLNLAIADFSFCLFLPLRLFVVEQWVAQPLDWILCKISSFTKYINMYTSVLFLTVISIDRCICVLYPIWSKSHRSSRLAAIISVIIWFLSIVLSSPYFIFSDTLNDDSIFYCINSKTPWTNLTELDYETVDLIDEAASVTEFVCAFLIPFFIIVICYGLIAFKVRRNSRILGSGQTFKILITTVLCFFFCWVLYYLVPIITLVNSNTDWPGSDFLYPLSECLAFFNSCLNPIIYVFIGRNYKQILRKSIPFLLESTFRERTEPTETQEDDTV
ncbi:chemokine-like receptor 1 [Xenopus laevis]|uniref:Chemokine-like receptor 1 n=1 Tax=Xenopus laevis TaxID=8355 RepID=A0A8J1LDE8_XENLA|nr:chemokine-like receptor 1 [Xenopus laevis]